MTDNFVSLMNAVAKRCPGGRIPDDYLVIDLETTGLPDKGREEYVTQFGYAAVQGRQIVDNDSTILKTPPGWIHPKAAEVTGLTDEIIQRDGVDPKGFYEELIKLFDLYAGKSMFVGHNIVKFDAPFLVADLKHHDIDYTFNPDGFIDTGMMFKASQIFASPSDDETLGQFFRRVGEIRSRTRWNLVFTMKRLGLDMKYGINVEEAHDAAFDCKMTHLLLEDLRQRAERVPTA